MRTLIYDTVENKTLTSIMSKPFKKLYPSGTLKSNQVELEVLVYKPECNPTTQYLTKGDPIIDLTNKTYTQVWIVNDKTPEQIELEAAEKDWIYPEFSMRIECPKILGEQYPQLYVNFVLRDLPIESDPNDEERVHIYCNTILDQHTEVLEGLQEFVTIKGRPEILTSLNN